jgi:hypothetical protein
MEVIDERDELHQRLIAVNKMNEDNYNKYCEALKRINKAINYCKNYMYTYGIKNNAQQRDELLNILGGDVDDE